MSTKTYRWKRGGISGRVNKPTDGSDAQVVGDELLRIRDERGALKPTFVVDEARPDDAPLHPYFEWRDDVAAEQFRISQAQHLIAAVCVVEQPDTGGDPVVTRAFISVDTQEDAHYEPVATVLADEILYLQVCRRACAELDAFQERYAQFQSLKSIGKEASDKAQAELALATEKAEQAA